VTPVAGGTPVESREVATTVTAPADTVAPVFGTLTAPSTIRKGTPTTLKVVVTDNVAVTSVTFFYTLNGQKGTAVATKSTTAANTWQAPVTFNATGKFSINATASDAAGNPANSTTVYTTVTQ